MRRVFRKVPNGPALLQVPEGIDEERACRCQKVCCPRSASGPTPVRGSPNAVGTSVGYDIITSGASQFSRGLKLSCMT